MTSLIEDAFEEAYKALVGKVNDVGIQALRSFSQGSTRNEEGLLLLDHRSSRVGTVVLSEVKII